jgi:hypothetical protein
MSYFKTNILICRCLTVCTENIFKERFNLTFGRPQVVKFSRCEELSVKFKCVSLNNTEKTVDVAKLLVHKKHAIKKSIKMKDMKAKCLSA